MKRNIQLIAILSLLSLGVVAQNGEGKIKVEITKEINGEKRTFKGEYNSTEEMKADPNYREFAGEEEGFNFWFSPGDQDMNLHLDHLKDMDMSNSFFHFFDGDEDDNSVFFHHLDSDSLNGFFNFNLNGMDMDEYKERMKDLGIELDVLMERLDQATGREAFSVSVWKKVSITEVEDEFGRKGIVNEDNRLALEDLNFYPNPSSNGKFKARFTVPDEDDLSIKVYDLEGQEVFTRKFDRFSGLYAETIDLSRQEQGIYLLEITQGKKRLTKKIVIN